VQAESWQALCGVCWSADCRISWKMLALGERIRTNPYPAHVSGRIRSLPLRRSRQSISMWSPQLYTEQGIAMGRSRDLLHNAVAQIEQVIRSSLELPAILTLNHLAERADVPYATLRKIVMREHKDTYRNFFIRKRSGGRRLISIPHPELLKVQRWLARYVLNPVPVHPNSFAFAPDNSIVKCASRHCGARWIVKMDILAFFPSLSELKVYRVFRAMGYGRLISFELARVTTYAPHKSFRYAHRQWINLHGGTIVAYAHPHQGFLPQGAPTSPMLSNLIMRDMDEKITKIALRAGMTYTRYADDLTFSLREGEFSRRAALQLVGEVQDALKFMGLYLNRRKTTISPPGSRKVVLGLLVNGSAPRLSREFRSNLRQHLHYAKNPTEHAKARGFDSVGGLRRHLKGLIDFAKMVDEPYGIKALQQFDSILWP